MYKHFFKSTNETELATGIRDTLKLDESQVSEIDVSDPLQAQRAISHQVLEIGKLQQNTSLVVDITTFRREELLILLKR